MVSARVSVPSKTEKEVRHTELYVTDINDCSETSQQALSQIDVVHDLEASGLDVSVNAELRTTICRFPYRYFYICSGETLVLVLGLHLKWRLEPKVSLK